MSFMLRKMDSPLGPLYLSATDKGLSSLSFEKDSVKQSISNPHAQKILDKAEKQLKEYFSGQRIKFDLPLDLKGTDFQKNVWKALGTIPFGKTYSYAQLAAKIGKKKAFRAVGNANGKNPVAIVIPCHRVIASDGSLGGYSSGLPRKVALLKIESVEIPSLLRFG